MVNKIIQFINTYGILATFCEITWIKISSIGESNDTNIVSILVSKCLLKLTVNCDTVYSVSLRKYFDKVKFP